MRAKPENGLFCLDDWDGLELMGGVSSEDSFRLEFTLVPCNLKFAAAEDPLDKIAEECIADLEQQRNYLKSPLMRYLVNNERFDEQGY